MEMFHTVVTSFEFPADLPLKSCRDFSNYDFSYKPEKLRFSSKLIGNLIVS